MSEVCKCGRSRYTDADMGRWEAALSRHKIEGGSVHTFNPEWARGICWAMHDVACNLKPLARETQTLIEENKQLRAEIARLAKIEPTFEIARRWCNRPESVLREGGDVLRNDVEMWLKLRESVRKALEPST